MAGINDFWNLLEIYLFSQLKLHEVETYNLQRVKIFFSPNDLLELDTIKPYGMKFYSPKNPEKYLYKFYGKNWRIPDKKQFVWKDKMKQILEDDKKEKKEENEKK